MTVAEGQLLWTPPEEVARNSNITRYMYWLRDRGILDVDNYDVSLLKTRSLVRFPAFVHII